LGNTKFTSERHYSLYIILLHDESYGSRLAEKYIRRHVHTGHHCDYSHCAFARELHSLPAIDAVPLQENFTLSLRPTLCLCKRTSLSRSLRLILRLWITSLILSTNAALLEETLQNNRRETHDVFTGKRQKFAQRDEGKLLVD